jgi:hypothetical protein
MALAVSTFEKKEAVMSWQNMRIPGGQANSLPGERGRYLIWLEPPLVEGEGHFVHFSWKAESFSIRDYIQGLERREAEGLTATGIWNAASKRIPCKGELYVPVENFEFWVAKCTEFTERHRQGTGTGLWSRLSSKFSPKPKGPDQQQLGQDNQERNNGDVYRRFIMLWEKGTGFDAIQRTVGCSARYDGEPLLWVYPSYFQVAPGGKGNAHDHEVRDSMYRHFPEARGKGTIQFGSQYFSWDRFENFVTDVKNMIQKEKN